MHRLFGFALLACVGSLSAAAPPEPGIPQAAAAMARLPLRFEENRGQWDPAVRFTARSAGANLQLTAHGPVFRVGPSRVEIGLVHANASPVIEPLDRLPADTNYLVGSRNQWHAGIANYARVRYQSVYPGIDVVYYGNQNRLEYDFVLAPGANPDAIRLNFHGDVQVSLTPGGDLTLDSHGAQVLQKAPVIYQDNRRIKGRYTLLAHNQVGFRLDRYRRDRPLVIDPILVYCAYMGSSGADRVTAMKMGPNGQLYITGSTNTGEMQFVNGAFDNFNAGLTDIFLAIVDTTPNGNFAITYFSYLGGANIDTPLALDVDANGVAYLAGSTTSTDFPMRGNSVVATGAATFVSGFVAVIDPSLYGGDSLVYSTYFGGTDGNSSVNGIALDSAGFIYIIGTTQATDLLLTTSGYAQGMFGTQDAFLAEIDRNSTSLVYSTYMGGELTDEGRSIAVGTNGKVYFAASTTSTQFPLEGPFFRQFLHGRVGIVVGMMDMTKFGESSLVYSTYFGGPGPDSNDHTEHTDEVRKIALDANNNVILTGYTLSPDFSVTSDAVQRNAVGNTDVFVSVVNPNDPPHFLVYSTYYGGTQGEVAYDVKPDAAGNIYFTGYTLSPDLFTVAAPFPGWGGGIDVFVAEIKPGTPGSAGLLFSTYLGATGTYVGSALVLGPDGSIYVGGYGNIGMPIDVGSPSGAGNAGGITDGFLVVLK
jgi:Beta-propeller repeat